ncbi:MAG: DciA family protein [Gammaproteobacteria bacterium]
MSDTSRNQPRSLGTLFGEVKALGALAQAAERHADLATQVRAVLGEPLGSYVSACNLRPDGTLIMTAASPEQAARLRFEAETVLKACRRQFPAASRVKVRVGTNQTAPTGTG